MNYREASERIADRYGIRADQITAADDSLGGCWMFVYGGTAEVFESRGATWQEAFDAMRWDLRGRAELARVVCEFLRWIARVPIVVASGDRCQACHSADPTRPNVPWCMACRATLDENEIKR